MLTVQLEEWLVNDLLTIENPRRLTEWQVRALHELVETLEKMQK